MKRVRMLKIVISEVGIALVVTINHMETSTNINIELMCCSKVMRNNLTGYSAQWECGNTSLRNMKMETNQQNPPWQMFRHDLNHTGRSEYETSATNAQLVRSFTTGGEIASSPTISSDGTIYIGSIDHNLYAIKSDGTLKWKYTTGNIVDFTSCTIGTNGTLYVGSIDRNLYAIKPDGTLKWKFSTNGYIEGSPSIGSDGTIYIGSYDKKVYAIGLPIHQFSVIIIPIISLMAIFVMISGRMRRDTCGKRS